MELTGERNIHSDWGTHWPAPWPMPTSTTEPARAEPPRAAVADDDVGRDIDSTFAVPATLVRSPELSPCFPGALTPEAMSPELSSVAEPAASFPRIMETSVPRSPALEPALVQSPHGDLAVEQE